MSSTKAAPGDNPLSMSAAAMGIDPVAHRYIGTDRASTSNMLAKGNSLKAAKKSSGRKTVMNPAIASPTTSQRPMSCTISTNP